MTGRVRSKWLFRAGVLGVVFVFAGFGAENRAASLRFFLVGGLLLTGVAMAVQGRTGSAGTMLRMSRRSRRRHGVASWWTVLRSASRFAVRRKMRVLRPSLRHVGFWRRLSVDTREVATPLARVGLLRVWSPVEDVTLRVGGPRVGKSGELAGSDSGCAGCGDRDLDPHRPGRPDGAGAPAVRAGVGVQPVRARAVGVHGGVRSAVRV